MPSTENRKGDRTPLYAVLGATDMAVERLRHAVAKSAEAQAQLEAQLAKLQHDLERAVSDFDTHSLQSAASAAPQRAAAAALQVASKAEARYEELAQRGRQLFDRVRSQAASQDLMAQGKSTISRTKGAATTVRKAADETAAALLSTISVGRRGASSAASSTAEQARDSAEAALESAKEAAQATERSATKTAATARKSAAASKSAAKGVRTSAGKTAASASRAAKATAKKVGD